MFTVENTGNTFTYGELQTLNAALLVRMERGEHESNASAAITNAFAPGCTVDDLTGERFHRYLRVVRWAQKRYSGKAGAPAGHYAESRANGNPAYKQPPFWHIERLAAQRMYAS